MCTVKRIMREHVRNIRGLANALGFDAEYLYSDIENFDLLCLGESIHETKITLQRLVDTITELEYQLYLLKRDENIPNDSRDKHIPL